MAEQRHISLPKPFASGDVKEWFQKYEICCVANGWDNAARARKLPTLLEGEALAVWLELTAEQQGDYMQAKKEIMTSIMPMEFVSMDHFHKRKLQPGEALSVFVHELKKLIDQAMPVLEKSARDQLLLHQFLAGIPNNVSRQLRATGEISTLEAAITRARLLMTIDEPQHTTTAAIGNQYGEVDSLKEQIAVLTEQVAALTTMKAGDQQRYRPRRCFRCNRTGHVQRECPLRNQRDSGPRRCYTCGQAGHLARNCHQGNEQGVPAMGNRHPYHQ